MARLFIHELKLFLQDFHGKQFLEKGEKSGNRKQER